MEIILVDDHSTDGSADICRAYAERYPGKVFFMMSEGDSVSMARNTGLAHVRGRYVAFADGDDMWLPGGMKLLLEVVESSGADIAVGGFTRTAGAKGSGSGKVTVADSSEAVIATLYQEPAMHTGCWAKLYRREAITAQMFAPMRYYEDIVATVETYLRVRKIAFVDSVVYYYRYNPDSITNTWSDGRLDMIWAVNTVSDIIQEKLPEAVPAAAARAFSARFNLFNLAVKVGREDIASDCYRQIVARRARMLADRRVRLKNKAGALASFLGYRALAVLGKYLG